MNASPLLGLLLAGLAACSHPSPAAEEPAATPDRAAAEAPAEGTPDTPSGSFEAHREIWDALLEEHQSDGGLGYAGLAEDRSRLDTYLGAVAEVRPDAAGESWSPEEKRAFRINAYNALVARGVLERYPDIESVIKVEGFFDAEKHTVAGEELTLNELEKKALSGDPGEPRVHFAVVCASTGCPDLRSEPFSAESLETQLEEQTAAFLGDSSKGVRYDEASNTLWLSSIFDWYGDDFGGDPVAWILPRLPEELAATIREASPEVRFIDYDWSLNDRP